MKKFTINKLLNFIPEEFRGDLKDGMQKSNPIKVDGQNYYLIMISSFNCCCKMFFLVRPEFPEGKNLVKYGVSNDTPLDIKRISAIMKDNIITVSCKTLNDDDLEFELFVV